MNYIVYDNTGIILRQVQCHQDFADMQAKENELIIEGTANDVTQKIKFDGLDDKKQPVNPRVVDKTPAEIEADNPAPIPLSLKKQPAHITNEQWQGILNRLDNLEAK